MSEKIIKGTLVGITGASAIASAYYGFIKPNVNIEEGLSTSQNTSLQTQNNENTSLQTNAGYKDGTYTGSVIKTKRGEFQVSVEVVSGKITNITMLTQPTNLESKKINDAAIPNYTKEAIEIQGSEINMISGASEAYTGFKSSLQSALNQAR